MRTFREIAALFALAGMASTSAVASTVIFDDFGPGTTYDSSQGLEVGGSSSLAAYRTSAMPFTSTGNSSLAQIDVALSYYSGTPEPVIFSLRSDSGGAPGSVLMSWTVSDLPNFYTCCTIQTLTPAAVVQLSAGTQYWLEADPSDAASSTFDLWNVNDTGATGTYEEQTGPGGPYIPLPGHSLGAFDVFGNSTVPEPASLGTTAAALGIFGLLLRRRERQY